MDHSEMNQIYEMSKRVYAKEITKQEAVSLLTQKNTASEASLKMYFDIYASMRNGRCYKHGTSAAFTEFLLNNIWTDNGTDALVKAISAAKMNSEYRESVNNPQPGIKAVCLKVISENSIDIEYDKLPHYQPSECVILSAAEKRELIDSIKESNADFAKQIMTLVEKYQVLENCDIESLTSRTESRERFRCDYPYIKEVNEEISLSEQVKDNAGRNRYYTNVYRLYGKSYVITSQLYGLGAQQTHADNRTPFYNWVLTKFDLSRDLGESLVGHFDSWEIVNDTTAIKTCDKSFFEHNGSGVPKEICWFFDAEDLPQGATKSVTLTYDGNDYTGRISNDTTDRRRIRIFWNTDLGNIFKSLRKDETQRLEFTKQNERYLIRFEGDEQEVSTKQTIEAVKDYIAAAGFTYPDGMIENFWLSLKSKPFVILAGTSGTGKTRLVRLIANAISAEYKLVAVRPDWSDSSDLFGHVDLNGSFIPGSVLDFMNQAKANPHKPYILCLDEMNLARVEYYLSDVLSIMETRELRSGVAESDPILTESYYGKDAAARERYGIQRIPENFYIVGTVNMDETTFPFSRKVLDRANTIEFSYVDLVMDFDAIPVKREKLNLSNDFLKTDYLFISQCAEDKEYIGKVCDELQKINGILQEANAHVGYRVRDEIVFYMLNNKKAGLIDEKKAFDNEIMQKILPRIQGSSASVKKLLCNLFVELEGSYSDTNGSVSENMRNYIKEKADKLRHPQSANKIFFMTRRFEEDGFTSYWL